MLLISKEPSQSQNGKLLFRMFPTFLCMPCSLFLMNLYLYDSRYYGRVQQAVHEFLLLGPDVVKADMTAQSIQDFFDVEKTVLIEAKKQSINGQCTKKDGDCKGKEIRDSRYNDMKTSMYLLANAFRINQTKAPDNLPTVQAAKAFFKKMYVFFILIFSFFRVCYLNNHLI